MEVFIPNQYHFYLIIKKFMTINSLCSCSYTIHYFCKYLCKYLCKYRNKLFMSLFYFVTIIVYEII
jgi:hypothetical protein